MDEGINLPQRMSRCRNWINQRDRVILVLMVLVSAAIRYILAAISSSAPSMVMDEPLYFSISRSLFASGEVLLRGQPVVYEYLLYPLILSLFHYLPPAINIFRAIELFNAVAISLAAIPAWLIGKRLTRSPAKGLMVALVTLCMPDLVMVRHIMSESIVYPLTLLLFYFFIRATEEGTGPRWALLCGLTTFLLHITKPGPIVIGAAMAVLLLFWGLVCGDRLRIRQAAWVVAPFILLYAGYRLLMHYGLHVDAATADYYARQMPGISWGNILNALNGALVYALYVPAAFVSIPLLLPVFQARQFKPSRRMAIAGLTISLILYAAVIVWTIYIGEMTEDPFVTRIHTRYLAMFLPVFFAFCLTDEMLKAKATPGLMTTAISLAAGWLLLSSRTPVSGNRFSVDSQLLAAFFMKSPMNGQVWMPLIWIAVTAFFLSQLVHRRLQKRHLALLSVIVLSVMLISNGAAYTLDLHNTNLKVAVQAEEAKALAGSEAMYVAANGQLYWETAMAIDMAFRGSIPMVELDDVVSGMSLQGMGAFTPKQHAKAVGTREVQPAQVLIIPAGLTGTLKLSQSAQAEYTDNRAYAVITPPEEGSWLHSAVAGLQDKWVREGSSFVLHDRELLSKEAVHLRLKVRGGDEGGTLRVACGAQEKTFILSEGAEWIELDLTVQDASQPLVADLSCDTGKVQIESYNVTRVY